MRNDDGGGLEREREMRTPSDDGDGNDRDSGQRTQEFQRIVLVVDQKGSKSKKENKEKLD